MNALTRFAFLTIFLVSTNTANAAVFGYGADGSYHEGASYVSASGSGWALEADSSFQRYRAMVSAFGTDTVAVTSAGNEGWVITNTGATDLILNLTTIAEASYSHTGGSSASGTATAYGRANMTVCDSSSCYDNYFEHNSSVSWASGSPIGSTSGISFQSNAIIISENGAGFEVELLIPTLVIAPGAIATGYATAYTEVHNAFDTSVTSDMFNTLQTTAVASHGNFTAEGGTNWITISQVPVPAAAWLFGSAVLGLVGVARRKKA